MADVIVGGGGGGRNLRIFSLYISKGGKGLLMGVPLHNILLLLILFFLS